jgi:hypothetical protein
VLIGSIHQHLVTKRSQSETQRAGPSETPTPTPPPAQASPDQTSYPEDLELTPTQIEFFINDHPTADLTRLWERLGIHDDDDPITTVRNECGGCRAQSFYYNLDSPPDEEVVLLIRSPSWQTDRYLIFKPTGHKSAKFLGHIDAWAKYSPKHPVVLLSNGQAWLIVQSTGATGSGLGAWIDTIYQVSDRGVRRVTSYLSEVRQSGYEGRPTKVFAGRAVSCQTDRWSVIVEVSYSVEYFGDLGTESVDLFGKQQTAVFAGSLLGGYASFNPTGSTMSQRENETIYNFDSMGEDDFLNYNRAELRALAGGNDAKKKEWLKEFLATCSRSKIKSELLALVSQSKHN